MTIPHLEIAARITGENHAAALKAAEEATYADLIVQLIDIERDIVYYDYWLLRCQIEPNDDTLEARKLIYEGDQAFNAAQLVKSRDLYVQGLARWRQVLDSHPKLLDDSSMTDPLMDSIKRYRSVLHQLDERFPQPFILQDVMDADVKFHGPGLPTSEPSGAGASADSSESPST